MSPTTIDVGLDDFGLVNTDELYNGLPLFDFDAPDQLFVEMEPSNGTSPAWQPFLSPSFTYLNISEPRLLSRSSPGLRQHALVRKSIPRDDKL